MDCPANIEKYGVDDEGRNYVIEVVACTGTLEGPVPNELTGNVEAVVMDVDATGTPNAFGREWYCSTCGQTTVVPDVRDAGS